MKHLKKLEGFIDTKDKFINGQSKYEQNINKISRYLSDVFYPNASKNTYPIKCNGFTELEHDYESYFLIWDEEKGYKEYPVTTILVPKYVIK